MRKILQFISILSCVLLVSCNSKSTNHSMRASEEFSSDVCLEEYSKPLTESISSDPESSAEPKLETVALRSAPIYGGISVWNSRTCLIVLSYKNEIINTDSIQYSDLEYDLSSIGILDIQNDTILATLSEAYFSYVCLINLCENPNINVFPINIRFGPVTTILDNGLFAVGTEDAKYVLYQFDGEPSKIQLDFDYGSHLSKFIDTSKGADPDYEFRGEAITYDSQTDRYIFVYTASPWLNKKYESDRFIFHSTFDNHVFDYNIRDIGVCTFDSNGKMLSQFWIPASEDLYLSDIGKGSVLYGSSRLFYFKENQYILSNTLFDKNILIDLSTNDYQMLSEDELAELIADHETLELVKPEKRDSYHSYIIEKKPACPLDVMRDELGTLYFYPTGTDDAIYEIEGGYQVLCYVMDEDGGCQIVLQ